MQNGTRKTMTGIATERGETATHSMQMLAKQIFNHLFFLAAPLPEGFLGQLADRVTPWLE